MGHFILTGVLVYSTLGIKKVNVLRKGNFVLHPWDGASVGLAYTMAPRKTI